MNATSEIQFLNLELQFRNLLKDIEYINNLILRINLFLEKNLEYENIRMKLIIDCVVMHKA